MEQAPSFEPYESPHVVGRVLRWSDAPSAYLTHPRDILVWLPPDYDEGERRYPVLYLQDGQNKFDPATAFGGEDWNVDGCVTDLVERRIITPPIMVAIANSPDRIAEYHPAARGRDYARFMADELMPIIEARFRTRGGRANALMGSSMGGLISLALAWWYPERYYGAACLSPSLWALWRAGGIPGWFRQQPRPERTLRLYFDHGTVGGEARIARHIERLMNFIEREELPVEAVDYFVAEAGEHNEASWRVRLERPLRVLLETPPNGG